MARPGLRAAETGAGSRLAPACCAERQTVLPSLVFSQHSEPPVAPGVEETGGKQRWALVRSGGHTGVGAEPHLRASGSAPAALPPGRTGLPTAPQPRGGSAPRAHLASGTLGRPAVPCPGLHVAARSSRPSRGPRRAPPPPLSSRCHLCLELMYFLTPSAGEGGAAGRGERGTGADGLSRRGRGAGPVRPLGRQGRGAGGGGGGDRPGGRASAGFRGSARGGALGHPAGGAGPPFKPLGGGGGGSPGARGAARRGAERS